MPTDTEMRVVSYYSSDDVRVEMREIPRVGPREILVEMKACGLCGGETMNWYHSLPKLLGHEPAGVVVDAGSEVSDFRVGDRVFAHHHVACMKCHYCLRGAYTLCEQYSKTRLQPSGMAEYFIVPEENLKLDTLKLPDHVSFEQGTLIEPMACVLKGIRTLGVQPGDTVAVVGVGFIGMSYIHLLSKFGLAARIIAVDLNDWRLNRAKELGATHAISGKNADVAQAIHDINDGRLADAVVSAAPSAGAWKSALSLVDKGGVFQSAAPPPPDADILVNANDLYFREIVFNSTFSATQYDTSAILDLLAAGRIRSDLLITHTFPMEETQKAVDLLLETGSSLKSIITP